MKQEDIEPGQLRVSAIVLACGSLVSLVMYAYFFCYKGFLFKELLPQFSSRPVGTTLGLAIIALAVLSSMAGLWVGTRPFVSKIRRAS